MKLRGAATCMCVCIYVIAVCTVYFLLAYFAFPPHLQSIKVSVSIYLNVAEEIKHFDHLIIINKA